MVPAQSVHPLQKPPPSGTIRIAFSLVALVLAPFSWWWSIDDPILRSTGLAAWMMLASALFLAISAAWRDKRTWVRVVAVCELGFAALFLWGFFVYQKLPAVQAPARALEFTLADQDGHPVSLSTELERGPVLLVFFRGHW